MNLLIPGIKNAISADIAKRMNQKKTLRNLIIIRISKNTR
jgi:hypothetical protein